MLNKHEQKIMNFLRRQAVNVSPVKSSRVCAAVVVKNNIITVGNNSRRSHPFQARYSKNPDAIFLHAEIDAIHNALYHLDHEDLRKATLMIFRVKRKNGFFTEWVDGLAKPCPGCMRAIVKFGFKKVIFSTETQDDYEILNRDNYVK